MNKTEIFNTLDFFFELTSRFEEESSEDVMKEYGEDAMQSLWKSIEAICQEDILQDYTTEFQLEGNLKSLLKMYDYSCVIYYRNERLFHLNRKGDIIHASMLYNHISDQYDMLLELLPSAKREEYAIKRNQSKIMALKDVYTEEEIQNREDFFNTLFPDEAPATTIGTDATTLKEELSKYIKSTEIIEAIINVRDNETAVRGTLQMYADRLKAEPALINSNFAKMFRVLEKYDVIKPPKKANGTSNYNKYYYDIRNHKTKSYEQRSKRV